MDFIFLNSSNLLKHLAILLIPTLALRNFLNKAIGIINFAKLFHNIIPDTDLISKFIVGLNFLLRRELLRPVFYGTNNFSAQFINIISHYENIVYSINVLQQTACLVVNPITLATLLSSLIERWVGPQNL